MTIAEIFTTCRRLGIVLTPVGENLDVDSPATALSDKLRAALLTNKHELLVVLARLDGMRSTVGKVPIPCAVAEVVGGPGRCFSCGATLSHPEAYGRCTPCDMACELFYRERPDAAEAWSRPSAVHDDDAT